jgi:hypothetical protein
VTGSPGADKSNIGTSHSWEDVSAATGVRRRIRHNPTRIAPSRQRFTMFYLLIGRPAANLFYETAFFCVLLGLDGGFAHCAGAMSATTADSSAMHQGP